MKNLKFVLVAAMMISAVALNAQKIAHINLDSLITLMPESKTAQEAVKVYYKQLEDQVVAMETELKEKYDEYQLKNKDWAELVRAQKEKDLVDMEKKIQIFQQNAQMDYQNKTAELSKPVYDKAKKAIDEVAKANGYKYVLDTSTGLVIYNEPADDIFNLVMKKLGITAPAPGTSVTPPGPSKGK